MRNLVVFDFLGTSIHIMQQSLQHAISQDKTQMNVRALESSNLKVGSVKKILFFFPLHLHVFLGWKKTKKIRILLRRQKYDELYFE